MARSVVLLASCTAGVVFATTAITDDDCDVMSAMQVKVQRAPSVPTTLMGDARSPAQIMDQAAALANELAPNSEEAKVLEAAALQAALLGQHPSPGMNPKVAAVASKLREAVGGQTLLEASPSTGALRHQEFANWYQAQSQSQAEQHVAPLAEPSSLPPMSASQWEAKRQDLEQQAHKLLEQEEQLMVMQPRGQPDQRNSPLPETAAQQQLQQLQQQQFAQQQQQQALVPPQQLQHQQMLQQPLQQQQASQLQSQQPPQPQWQARLLQQEGISEPEQEWRVEQQQRAEEQEELERALQLDDQGGWQAQAAAAPNTPGSRTPKTDFGILQAVGSTLRMIARQVGLQGPERSDAPAGLSPGAISNLQLLDERHLQEQELQWQYQQKLQQQQMSLQQAQQQQEMQQAQLMQVEQARRTVPQQPQLSPHPLQDQAQQWQQRTSNKRANMDLVADAAGAAIQLRKLARQSAVLAEKVDDAAAELLAPADE